MGQQKKISGVVSVKVYVKYPGLVNLYFKFTINDFSVLHCEAIIIFEIKIQLISQKVKFVYMFKKKSKVM